MPDENSPLPTEVRFEYVKIPDYRTYRAEGVFGGITPKGSIFVSLFIDRPSIPTVVVYALNDGVMGDEKLDQRVDREGLIREVQAGFTMDLRTAISFRVWLDDKIKTLEEFKERQRDRHPATDPLEEAKSD